MHSTGSKRQICHSFTQTFNTPCVLVEMGQGKVLIIHEQVAGEAALTQRGVFGMWCDDCIPATVVAKYISAEAVVAKAFDPDVVPKRWKVAALFSTALNAAWILNSLQ